MEEPGYSPGVDVPQASRLNEAGEGMACWKSQLSAFRSLEKKTARQELIQRPGTPGRVCGPHVHVSDGGHRKELFTRRQHDQTEARQKALASSWP